jgi:hypothetical protein
MFARSGQHWKLRGKRGLLASGDDGLLQRAYARNRRAGSVPRVASNLDICRPNLVESGNFAVVEHSIINKKQLLCFMVWRPMEQKSRGKRSAFTG